MPLRILLLALSLLAAGPAFCAEALVAPDDVRFASLDEGFRVDIDMLAPVPLAMAWKVLTDFNGMAKFAANLTSSRIIATNGNRVRVAQTGFARLGPLSQAFESVRDITLTPMKEIVAHQVSGSARRVDSRMRLKALDDGSTRLEYRVEVVPETSLPPLIGPAIVRHEMAEQFSLLIGEMKRRQAAGGSPPATPAQAQPQVIKVY